MRKYYALPVVILIAVAFLSVGCTKYATKDQLKSLDDTQASALAAEKSLEDKKAERAEMEKKAAQKESELQAKKQEKEQLAKTLGK